MLTMKQCKWKPSANLATIFLFCSEQKRRQTTSKACRASLRAQSILQVGFSQYSWGSNSVEFCEKVGVSARVESFREAMLARGFKKKER